MIQTSTVTCFFIVNPISPLATTFTRRLFLLFRLLTLTRLVPSLWLRSSIAWRGDRCSYGRRGGPTTLGRLLFTRRVFGSFLAAATAAGAASVFRFDLVPVQLALLVSLLRRTVALGRRRARNRTRTSGLVPVTFKI